LQPGRGYVSFNGNSQRRKLHFHGRGYRIATLLRRSGYFLPEEIVADSRPWEPLEWQPPAFWAMTKRLFGDLKKLAEMFGLVIAGWHPKLHEWADLEMMKAKVRSRAGQKWLLGCLIRIYTEEDFLPRWRKLFAERMGFKIIPDGSTQDVPAGELIESREQCVRYLQKAGITPNQFAKELGVSKTLVSLHLSGQRPWNAKWQSRIASWLAQCPRAA
jgi:hypothetical protein